MRKAIILVNDVAAGVLAELNASQYYFEYYIDYQGPPVSLTMPIKNRKYEFKEFPPFFDGLLPEGNQLEALLRLAKLDRNDLFGQLIQVGQDLVGTTTVEQIV